MSLVTLLIAVIVLGLVLYVISNLLPIEPQWLRSVALLIVILIFILYITGNLSLRLHG